MSLQKRLLLWFMVLVLMAAALGLFGLWSADGLGRLAITVYDGPLMTIDYAKSAALKFERLDRQVSAGMYAVKASSMDAMIDDISGDLAIVAQRSGDKATIAGLSEVKRAVADWQGAPLEAKPALAVKALQQFDSMVDASEAAGYQYRVQALERVSMAKRDLLFGIGGAGVIGFILALLVARQISRPIRLAVDALDRLASGDLEVDIAGKTEGKNEAAKLFRAISAFRDASRSLVDMQAAKAEEDQLAADRRRADLARVADGYESTVRLLISELGASVGILIQQAESVADSAEVSLGESNVVAERINETTASVSEVGAAMREFAISNARISEEVADTSKIAKDATTRAEVVKDRVNGLASSAQRIQEVAGLISRVARTTNLLALNAAVEASRAGKAGLGFAVVASEVKVLAAETSRATEEIASLVNTIGEASLQAVAAIDGITETVGSVGSSAALIARAVEQQAAAGELINQNVATLAKASEGVARSISVVAERARTTHASSSEATRTGRLVNATFEKLEMESEAFLRAVTG